MNTRIILGPVLILLGAFVFLTRGEAFHVGTIFAYFWPSLFVIPLGLFFHWMFFSMTRQKTPGLLIPGGILLTAGIVCQISMLFNSWGTMWPGFILAVAVGLFEFYWFSGRNRYLLIPINILTVLSLLFFAVFSISSFLNDLPFSRTLLAIGLVIIGAFMLIVRNREI